MTLAPQVYLVGGMLRDIYISGYHGLATPTVQFAELALYCYLQQIPVPRRLKALQTQVAQLYGSELAQLQNYLRTQLVDCSFSQVASLLQDYASFLQATDLASARQEFCRVFAVKDFDWDYALEGYTFAQLEELAQQEPRLKVKAPFYLRNEQLIFVLNRRETKIAPGFNGFSYDMEQVSVAQDSLRRDLTINAFYLPLFQAIDVDQATNIELVLLEFDKLIDASGHGFDDLESKILRPVHSQRFLEDPIRGLRALYFAQLFPDFEFCADFPFSRFTAADLIKTYNSPVNITNFYWNKFLNKGVLNQVLTSGVEQGYFDLFTCQEWCELLQANPSLAEKVQELDHLHTLAAKSENFVVKLPTSLVAKHQEITQSLIRLAKWLDKILSNLQWLCTDYQAYFTLPSVLTQTHQAYHNCLNRLKSAKLEDSAYAWLVVHQYSCYILECYFFKTIPQEWQTKPYHQWLRAYGIDVAQLKKLPAKVCTSRDESSHLSQFEGHPEFVEKLLKLAQFSYAQVLDPQAQIIESPLNSLLDPHELQDGYIAESIEISLRNQLQLLLAVWMQELQQLGLPFQYSLADVAPCLFSTLGINNNLFAKLCYYLFMHCDEPSSVLIFNAVLLQSLVQHYKLGVQHWIAQTDFEAEIAQQDISDFSLTTMSLLNVAVTNLPYPLQLIWNKLGYK